ncbi:MAG: DUF2442 domain-containing protein [Taibaiella sp.]|nr:DUF2442 domain-containing protein [Taibaiella sp.]
MNPRVVSVKVLADYVLDLTFENGEKGHFSMKPYLDFPVYNALKDYALFEKARVTFGFISWSDDIDMSPDNLYLETKMLAV